MTDHHQSGNMSWITIVVLLGFALIVFLPSESSDKPDPFKGGGYFRGESRDRIYTVFMDASVTADQALQYARKTTSTPGQMTAVYFYPKGAKAPIDGITQAKNLAQANHVLYEMRGLDGWRYAYMKFWNGNDQIVDCQNTPDSDFCR